MKITLLITMFASLTAAMSAVMNDLPLVASLLGAVLVILKLIKHLTITKVWWKCASPHHVKVGC